ncbi:CRISPR-associated nuclease/helicase Cas3 subtype I-F/YPEST [Vibrio aerogenes CECT 7868]|uniref:CRISPR-associated nuclease/helicase Cas3 subtype I-F/YPEST n=1 Tax=Vibrio aerogenes CECT 7868 TaxID=1216006 RepID=A0A1M5VI08_9VIBR|nr:type I-F CRISPR-associated helicase Cas3f [Vibrio aerogenes]SHH74876.1 CRISPR-associated nuclease/helicase Cas3 subtype I-F/YPEST [Vibrio aerogenes CECT 7868]
MNVFIVSECSKQALTQTRQILDQFAERKGRRTWQTPITAEGLKTLRMLLRKKARRNTAVACYWIRGKNHTELMWIVGNRRKFNADGTVPTNLTQRNILRSGDENPMNSIQAAALMAGIAGLFHDFGKANPLFQAKLERGSGSEPYRHEWLSCQWFILFVGQRSDQQWLEHLTRITGSEDISFPASFDAENLTGFHSLPTIAKAVAWLILTHHRLLYDHSEQQHAFDQVDSWLENTPDVKWNALNHEKFTDAEKKQCLTFPAGTPIQSRIWRRKAAALAKRALNTPKLSHYATIDQPFPLHIARLTLMLADHCYSAGPATLHWQDSRYPVIANTDRKTRQAKQQLDEHCVGVAHHAYLLTRILPRLRSTLPALPPMKKMRQPGTLPQFRWQYHAYREAEGLAELSRQAGFFGVNMASTGKGKTFANARIMAALSDPQQGCRFSVALGLRTLTLQTGDALRQKLNLDQETIAVQIGSQAVRDLYDHQKQPEMQAGNHGSESSGAFDELPEVIYDGEIDNHYLSDWLKARGNAHKLVSAPVLVSTVDHLITASEGIRGGQQIAPLLRLLTSDLVLDEPDDFSLEDDPALGRLVWFAGLMGSRVLLSSATLTPALVTHLFACYQQGRQAFNRVTGEQTTPAIPCAWFDEFSTRSTQCGDEQAFKTAHQSYVDHRIEQLQQHALPLHLPRWLPLKSVSDKEVSPAAHIAHTIYQGICALSAAHKTRHPTQTQTVSCGMVRIANIEPLVAIARQLSELPAPDDCRIHYCVYHSQLPLAQRAYLEHRLDRLLQRNADAPEALFENEDVKQALLEHPEQHHIFVVLASPVIEVGRDLDFDWAILEPSSLRSWIQAAGRVQRHRRMVPQQANIYLLNRNYRAFTRQSLAYTKPGYETDQPFQITGNGNAVNCLRLAEHDLAAQVDLTTLTPLTAIPRLTAAPLKALLDAPDYHLPWRPKSWLTLEHAATMLSLNSDLRPWWQHQHAHLFGQFQRQTRFRKSRPTVDYLMIPDEESGDLTLQEFDPQDQQWKETVQLKLWQQTGTTPDNSARGISFWGAAPLTDIIDTLADQFELSTLEAYQRFSRITLDKPGNKTAGKSWFVDPVFGVFRGREM